MSPVMGAGAAGCGVAGGAGPVCGAGAPPCTGEGRVATVTRGSWLRATEPFADSPAYSRCSTRSTIGLMPWSRIQSAVRTSKGAAPGAAR